jgi:serine/threonine-protein kinase
MGSVAAPQVVGRYAIYDQIASGAMATVHLGRLLGTAGFARTVAVKRLHPSLVGDPEFQATLIDEARLASRIHHPNVVTTIDVVSAEGELLLVMEYVRGESLARLLRSERGAGRGVAPAIVSAILVGVLSGLDAAHEVTSEHGERLGLVHRDVSPQNILVGVDGLARLIDFGVAKARGRLQSTEAGIIKGKLAYMSPEQLGVGKVNATTDIYAASVVLWEALTGQRLFSGDSEAALARKVVAGATEPPSRFVAGLSPDLDAVVMKGLALQPSDRFQTAREMANALQRASPPAFASEVGEWCVGAAKQALDQRRELVLSIERSSESIEVVAPTTALRAPPPVPPPPLPPPPPPGAASPPISRPVEPSTAVDVELPQAPSPLVRALRSPVVAVCVVGGGVALVVLIWLLIQTPPPPPVATPDTPDPRVAPSAVAAQAPTSENSPPPVMVTPGQPAGATPNPAIPPASMRRPPPPHVAPQKPRPSCNPSFTVDSRGVQHPKPECM